MKLKWSLRAALERLRGQSAAGEVDPAHLKVVRLAMLEALGEKDSSKAAALQRRIRYSADLERLWYLRAELMDELGAVRGEVAARQILADITALFEEVRQDSAPIGGPQDTTAKGETAHPPQ